MEVEQEARAACNRRRAPGERNWAWGKKARRHLITRVEKNRAEMSRSLSVTSSGCLLLEPEVDCYLNSFFFFFFFFLKNYYFCKMLILV